MSVPNQEAAAGARRRWLGLMARGSAVPSQGARAATASMTSSRVPPAAMVGWRRTPSTHVVGAGAIGALGVSGERRVMGALAAEERSGTWMDRVRMGPGAYLYMVGQPPSLGSSAAPVNSECAD